jgi:hypothetical protein
MGSLDMSSPTDNNHFTALHKQQKTAARLAE